MFLLLFIASAAILVLVFYEDHDAIPVCLIFIRYSLHEQNSITAHYTGVEDTASTLSLSLFTSSLVVVFLFWRLTDATVKTDAR